MLLSVLLALSPITAAAGGVNLRWNACFGDGGAIDRTSLCNTNNGNAGQMVVSYKVFADVPQAIFCDMVIDLAAADATLPAWWTVLLGGCRQFGITGNSTISGLAVNCVDWSGGTATGGLQTSTVGAVFGPASARMVVGFQAPLPVPVLANGTEYFAGNVVLSNTKTTGAGSCTGCTTPVCLAVSSVGLYTPPPGGGVATRTVVITNANSPGSNFVTWQGGAGASSTLGGNCPAATPAQNSTWGAVKSLYR